MAAPPSGWTACGFEKSISGRHASSPPPVAGTPSANNSPIPDGSDPDPVLSQVTAACPVFP